MTLPWPWWLILWLHRFALAVPWIAAAVVLYVVISIWKQRRNSMTALNDLDTAVAALNTAVAALQTALAAFEGGAVSASGVELDVTQINAAVTALTALTASLTPAPAPPAA